MDPRSGKKEVEFLPHGKTSLFSDSFEVLLLTYSKANAHRAAIDLAARAIQHFARQGALNLLEELVLLAPDMRRQQRAKPLQQRAGWRRAQLRDQDLDRAVFRHESRD